MRQGFHGLIGSGRVAAVRILAAIVLVVAAGFLFRTAFADFLVSYGAHIASQGRPGSARIQLNIALALNPNDPMIYVHRGNTFAMEGDSARAEEDWDRALALNPNHVWAHYSKGIAKVRRGELGAAVLELDVAIEQGLEEPHIDEVFFHRAELLALKGEYARAVLDDDEVIRRVPDQPRPYASRALHLAELGRCDDARQDASRATALRRGVDDTQLLRTVALVQQRCS